MSKVFGLPPLTAELKPLSPYLQRAEDVKPQDQIVAYWCAYYAAQLGISLKAQGSASRQFLFDLLGVLERMKKDIGPNDTVDNEPASSAYVEDFALKVFAQADNEDRKEEWNKFTARKFLAAANFLEVLKVFSTIEVSESNENKIRYAKWRAADISKALREGRRPTPGGPTDVGRDPSPPSTQISSVAHPSPPPPVSPGLPPKRTSPSPDFHLPPSPPKRTSPSPDIHLPDITHVNVTDPHTPPPRTYLGLPNDTPDNWSTAATPGTISSSPYANDGAEGHGVVGEWDNSPLRDHGSMHVTPQGSDGTFRDDVFRSDHVNEVVEASDDKGPESPLGHQPSFPFRSSIPSAPSVPPPPIFPPQVPVYITRAPNHPQPEQDVEVELTPEIVTKAQRHMRFAISALDYEDAETSRKELRNALTLLGGRY